WRASVARVRLAAGRSTCARGEIPAPPSSSHPKEPRMSKLSAQLSIGRFRSLVRQFSSVDLRSLGVLRVVLGALLIADLRDRLRVVDTLYSNDGVLSNHYSLFRPLAPFQFSFYVGPSSAREVTVAFAVTLLVYLLFTLGYRTRLFHVLSFVCVTSLH